jgi:hypothetical protein
MPLNVHQESYVVDLLGAVGESPGVLRGWDKGFIDDLQKNFDEKESDMMMTPPMWRQVERIGKTKFGLDFEQYQE